MYIVMYSIIHTLINVTNYYTGNGVNEKEKRLGCGDVQCMHIEPK